MVYFIADPHFGDTNIIRNCNRPFRHVEEMNEIMIQAWNERVEPDDTVYILGDLMFGCDDPEFYLTRLQGKKHLILGNHDGTWIKKLEKQRPGAGSWHIYGHTHNSTQFLQSNRAYNAAVELNGYRPVTLDELVEHNLAFRAQLSDPIKDYLKLSREKPELFVPNEDVPIVLDEDKIRGFSDRTGKAMGIVYSNKPFYVVVADLCQGRDGLYSYARIIYPNSINGAVVIPQMDGKYGLLRNFRHVPRIECLEFPRGFAEEGLTPEENIRKELVDEINGQVLEIKKLGQVRADTGLAAGCVDIYLAELADTRASVGHEGIRQLLWLSEKELSEKIISGEITDGFTLSALTLLRNQVEL